MILVDTSIWIRFLMNKAPYAEQLAQLLENDDVMGHDLVYGELLIGDSGGRRALLKEYERMSHAAVVPHRELVNFVRHFQIHGRGAGWIDIHLLASARVERTLLWTADPRLSILAKEFGVRYEPQGLIH